MDIDINPDSKRPCCLLLRHYSEAVSALNDPLKTQELLDTLSKHCVALKKTTDITKMAKLDCYLAMHPDEAQQISREAEKTAIVYLDANDVCHTINHIISHNAVLQTIQAREKFLLKELREGSDKSEKKFGRVPMTDLLDKSKQSHGLSAGEHLHAHPLLAEKPQFDGINPKDNANPQQNPEAAENAEKLQLQLQNQLQNQYKNQYKASPPKPTPRGA